MTPTSLDEQVGEGIAKRFGGVSTTFAKPTHDAAECPVDDMLCYVRRTPELSLFMACHEGLMPAITVALAQAVEFRQCSFWGFTPVEIKDCVKVLPVLAEDGIKLMPDELTELLHGIRLPGQHFLVGQADGQKRLPHDLQEDLFFRRKVMKQASRKNANLLGYVPDCGAFVSLLSKQMRSRPQDSVPRHFHSALGVGASA